MSFFTSKIIAKRKVAEQTWEAELERPTGFSFEAGQYIWLVLPKLLYPDSKGERMAFSITSSIFNKGSIIILYRDSDSGYKKTLADLQLGADVQIIGPFGSSCVPKGDKKNIVLISGGVGIAPFLSILRSLEENPIQKIQYTLINLNSSLEKVVFFDELSQITKAKKIPFVNEIGEFRENILPSDIDFVNDIFFIIGPAGMVESVYEVLKAKSVPFEHMHFEQNYPSPPGNLKEEAFIAKDGEKSIMLDAFRDSRIHLIITDANGKIIFANKASEEYTGFTFDEMRGNTPRLWGGLMKREHYQDLWHKKIYTGGYDGELTNRKKNGEIYFVLAHISAMYDQLHNIVGYIGTEENITELKRIQQNDEAMLKSIGDGLIAVDNEGKIIRVNEVGKKMLGWKEGEIVTKYFSDVVPIQNAKGEIVPENVGLMVIALTTGKSTASSDNFYIRKDGTRFPVAITVAPIVLEGKIIGAINVFRDITKEKETDRMKTEFISLASHQLRTPLSAMRWFSEMLLEGDAGQLNKEQSEFVQNISDSNTRMIGLVNALLNISRIESGRITVDPKPTDILELVRQVVDELRRKINDRKLEMVFSQGEKLPFINIDPGMIRQVYVNLLTNAVKYTKSGGQVQISISKKGNEIISRVSDNGLGIPEHEQSKIFGRFFRASNAVKVATDGTGLGLYLAKLIVESSGGRIWFKSEEGKGTTFWFTLPISGMISRQGQVTLA